MSIRFHILLRMALLLLITGTVYGFILAGSRRHAVLEKVDAKLLTAARALEYMLPPNYHDAIKDKTSVTAAQFESIVDNNNRFCVSDGLQYVWSVLVVDPRHIYFTSSTSPDHRTENGLHAKFFDLHQDPNAFSAALAAMEPHFSTFKNEWGWGRMILVPQRDKQGRVIMFGASIGVPELADLMRNTLLRSVALAGVVLLPGFMIIILLSRKLSTDFQRAAAVAERIAGGDFDYPVSIGGAREVAQLSRSLSTMRDSIRTQIQDLNRAKEEVSESRKTFVELVERAPFGIYTVDSQFRIAQMNSGSQNGAFKNVRPVIGRDFSEAMRILWPEPVAAGIIDAVRHTLDTGEAYYSPRFTNPRHDVEVVESYEWELHRLMLPDGQYGVICYYFDSTNLRNAEAALRKSEERFRVAQELSLDAFAILEAVRDDANRIIDFRWTYANPAFGRILRQPASELTGKYLLKMAPGNKSNSDLFDRYVRVVETGEAHDYELRYKSDGIEGWFRNMAVKIGDGVAVYFMDITERKRSEELLTLAKEQVEIDRKRLATILETVPSAIVVIDAADGKFSYLNKRAAELYGFDYTGVDITTHVAKVNALRPDGKPYRVEEVPASRSLARGDVVHNEEMVLERPDGERFPVLVSSAPLLDAKGTITAAIAVFEDIRERKQQENALWESEERLRFALETSQIGAWDLDLIDHTAHRSLEHDRIFGYDQILPKWTFEMFLEHVLPENREAVAAKFHDAIEKHSDWNFECRIRRKDGAVRWIRAAGRHREGVPGQLSRMAGIVEDITERKKAEQILEWNARREGLLSVTAARLLATADPQGIVEDLCREVMDVLDCQVFFNFLVDDAAKRLHLNACGGIPAEEARRIEWLDYGVAVCGCVARDAKRIIAEDIQNSGAAIMELVKSYGVQAYCCHPLLVEKKLIGTLSFGTRSRAKLTPDEIGVMEAVANLVAVAMARIRAKKQIEDSLHEKEVLLKEVHHRVKNNLQIIKSLLRLQSDASGDPKMAAMLKDSQNRVQSMALVHESLYRSKSLSELNLAEYVNVLVNGLRESYRVDPNIQVRVDAEPIPVLPDLVISCGLILNELVANALKHAFRQGQPGEVFVELRKFNEDEIRLVVRDTGTGFPKDFDMASPATLGLQLVRGLTDQIKGTLTVSHAGGTTFLITFPLQFKTPPNA